MEVVKLLLSLKGDRYIDVHACNEEGFYDLYDSMCYGLSAGDTETLDLLLSLDGDRKIRMNRYKAKMDMGFLTIPC